MQSPNNSFAKKHLTIWEIMFVMRTEIGEEGCIKKATVQKRIRLLINYCAGFNSSSNLILISLPTNTPPVSRAAFHVKPNSSRSIFAFPSKP